MRFPGERSRPNALQAIKKAKHFFAPYQNKLDNFKFSLAGGVIGTMAAINEVVGFYSELARILIYLIIFIFCAFTYGSFVAGIILTIPVALSDFLSVADMAIKDIGLNINTLPVASVGVGIGLDYGVYILSRIREEYQKVQDLDAAILKGVTTSGKAVAFTATTLIGGVIFWYFISDLRFQGEMGFLLAFLMFFNMLGAIFLVPTLVCLPEFAREFEAGATARWAILAPGGGPAEVVGTCNYTQIFRGAYHACTLGYQLARRHEGRGLMFEALTATLGHAFRELRVHRVMANYRPENARSGRLLDRLGFVREGYAREYLFIDGAWRDHVLTAKANPDFDSAWLRG